MRFFRNTVISLVIAALFFAVPSASAHRPENGDPEGLTVIPDASTSFAYYREFTEAETMHIYSIEARAGQFFHAGINIPQLPGLENYGVALALFGPGLPEVDIEGSSIPNLHEEEKEPRAHTQQLISLDAEIGLDFLEGQGGLVVESQQGEDFFEPFTQTRYWGRQVLELDLPETGRYYLLVWSPDGSPGKYVLDTGKEEVFGAGDLLRFPVWWINTRLYFEQAPQLIAGSFAFLGFLITGIVLVIRKRNR